MFLKKTLLCSVLGLSQNAFSANLTPIRLNVDSLPLSMEPSKVNDIIANWILHLVGQRLIETNDSGILRGDLAKEWEVIEGGKEFRFKIRTDAKFSDGTSLTADSIKTSFETAKKSKANFSFYLERLQKIEVLDKETLILKLDQAMPSFLQILGEPMFTISKTCGDNPCFSGSFQISQKTSRALTIKRNIDGQLFIFEELEFDKALSRFNSGDLEILRSYGAGNAAKTRLASKGNVLIFEDAKSYFLALNSQKSTLNSPTKRLAFKKNLNFAAGEKWLESKDLKLSTEFVSPSMLPIPIIKNTNSAIQPSLKDNNSFKIVTLKTHEIDELATKLFSNFNTKIISQNKLDFVTSVKNGDYDAILVGYSVTLRDIDYLSIFFNSGSFHNLARLSSKEADNLIKKGWLASTVLEKKHAIEGILKLNETDGLYLPLTHCPLVFAFSEKLKTQLTNSISTTILDLNKVFYR